MDLQNPKTLLGYADVVSKEADQNLVVAIHPRTETVGRVKTNISLTTMCAHEKLLKLSMDIGNEAWGTYSCKRVLMISSYYCRTFKAAMANWTSCR